MPDGGDRLDAQTFQAFGPEGMREGNWRMARGADNIMGGWMVMQFPRFELLTSAACLGIKVSHSLSPG